MHFNGLKLNGALKELSITSQRLGSKMQKIKFLKKLRVLKVSNGAKIKNRYNQVPHLTQWLSGRVLDSRPKGRGFEPHRRHCVVVLEQDTFILA